jgi:large subunit ribosomal protein L23
MVDANVYLVVRKPLLTEKNMHRAEKRREYTFDVDVKANKIEIRRAVESLYNVKVARVHTVTKQGLKRRPSRSAPRSATSRSPSRPAATS